MFQLTKQGKNSEQGQGLVEYALILVLVAVAVIIVLSLLGPAIGNVFSNVLGALDGVVSTSEPAGPQGCTVNNAVFGTLELPESVRVGGNDGTWNWTGGGNTLKHTATGTTIRNPGGWAGGTTASGDCSPF